MISIGIKIRSILADSSLTAILGGPNRVAPLVMDEEVDYPFIVYGAVGLDNSDSKDSEYDIDIESVIVVAGDYDSSLSIAQKVRELMEEHDDADEKIYRIALTNRVEAQNADAYMQLLTFEIENLKY